MYIQEAVMDILVAKMERLEDQIQSLLFAQVQPRTMNLMWGRAFSQYYGEDCHKIYENYVKRAYHEDLVNCLYPNVHYRPQHLLIRIVGDVLLWLSRQC
jgi:hypothetical protein